MEDYIDRGRESKDGTHDFLAARYPIQEWRWWWWWWPSDIQRYHPRIYCSVKPGRQLGYKLVLCIALPLLHLVYIYIYILFIYIYIHLYIGGPSSGLYESRMFMLLAAAPHNLANIGSQFNDRPAARTLYLPASIAPPGKVRFRNWNNFRSRANVHFDGIYIHIYTYTYLEMDKI